ncbi:MAG: TrmH family RNA methyltransferase [Thermodesulfobacteriota bacterium]|nr:TrmH family RNA methyltransferase [Thermodesulfobacteriota bacterium]
MMRFNFTRKKFLSLPACTRHRRIIKWLTWIYQKMAANRISVKSLDLFFENYCEILGWLGQEQPIRPVGFGTRPWIEFVSDAIHYHRIKADLRPRDDDLLPVMQNKDRHEGQTEPVPFEYHLALDGLRSLFNVGSIFRICDAGGFKSVILGNTPGKESPVVQKTSMGAARWVPQTETQSLLDTLEEKKKEGYTIIGLETVQGSSVFSDYQWPLKGIIVLGNEEYGISSHVLRVCDDFVHIPMFGRKNSINVAAAASVVVFYLSVFFKPAL